MFFLFLTDPQMLMSAALTRHHANSPVITYQHHMNAPVTVATPWIGICPAV